MVQTPDHRVSSIVQLDLHLKASYKLIHFCSQEEPRAELALLKAARQPATGSRQRTCFVWSETQGFLSRDLSQEGRLGEGTAADGAKDTENPVKALQWLIARERKGTPASLYVFKDLHGFLDPRHGRTAVIRHLKDAVQVLEPTHSSIILLSGPQLAVPPELDKECVIIDFDLPSVEQLRRLFEEEAKKYASVIDVRLQAEDYQDLAEAAKGLTEAEALLAFGKAVVEDKRLDRGDIKNITDEKKQIVRKTGILTFEEPDTMESVGGLEILKRWLQKRQRVFSPEARDFGIQAPKGLMLTGIPGCGKSLCARAMASIWNLPILRLDMGAVMGGIVGASEANMRTATRSAEAMAPCILMIDEIEKGLGGASGNGGDGGTTSRVFGYLLSWMNDKKAPVFIVATANNFERLPPEMLRKGRFDEIFFVDFPNASERRQILEIHIRKALARRGGARAVSREAIDAFLGKFEFDRRFEISRGTVAGRVERVSGTILELSRNFTGSELEEAIKTALIEAFAAGREFTAEDVARALGYTVPLIDTMRDKINDIRTRALECAVSASPPDETDALFEAASELLSKKPSTEPPPVRGGRMLDI